MSRLCSILVLVFALACDASAQTERGVVREGLRVASTVLGRDVLYTVYLPPGYDESSQSYPVVYLLHGGGGDHTEWIQAGEAHLTADEALARREVPPMILVMPAAGNSAYIDSYDGALPYERFFVGEFIPHIESAFRVRPGRSYRAVAGVSVGGYGALMLALRHPDLFATSVAFGASVRRDADVVGIPDERWDNFWGPVFGRSLRGNGRLNAHWRQHAPLDLVREGALDALRSVRWWIDCGDDDALLYGGNAALHVLLREREIPHEYRVRDGGHAWAYWRGGLAEALAFVGDGFRN